MIAVGTDSFVTLAEAETYAATLTFAEAWNAATDAGKEAALKQAARLMGAPMRWLGHRTSEDQPLSWPRYDMVDADGYSIESTVVPQQVRDAQCEYAVRLIGEDRTADAGALVPEVLGIGSLKVERLSRSPVPASVLELLHPFLAATSSGGNIVGVLG